MNQIRDEVMRLENEINAIKNGLDTNASVELTVAEKIQLRIKKEKEERRKEGKRLKTQKMDDLEDIKAKISENLDNSKEDVNTEYLAEKQEEVKKKEEEMKRKIGDKKKNDMMVLKAEKLIEEGRKALEEKEFDTAKELYGQAKSIFERINFVKQVKFLTGEINNIDALKREYKTEVERERLRKEIREQEFRERLEKDLDRKIGEMNQ